MTSEVVFFLEEESAKVLLTGLFPKLVPEGSAIEPRFIVFEGKQDLEKQLPKKLQGYRNPRARFIVLRDQDAGLCEIVKQSLVALCAGVRQSVTTVRVACHELEAFYLGDLQAVETGLQINGLAAKQNQAKFRDPDRLHSPGRELEELTRNVYQKVAGSRAITPHLNLDNPRSKSFYHLLQAIRGSAQMLHRQGV